MGEKSHALSVAVVAVYRLLHCHLIEQATSHWSGQLTWEVGEISAATFCSAACAVRSEASSCWVLLSSCCSLRRARKKALCLPRSEFAHAPLPPLQPYLSHSVT